MSCKDDVQFSKDCDVRLSQLWGEIGYGGRFVFTPSKNLQLAGIDILLQGEKNNSDIKIDTKHARRMYPTFFLEEMSCTNPGREKLGWILKENSFTDYIFYTFWENENTLNYSHIYSLKFNLLKSWFTRNMGYFKLHIDEDTINRTSGRIVPIKTLVSALGAKTITYKDGIISQGIH